jgi:fermentation-respiration switch protein FrsA (DUF1100 family)
MLILDSGSSIIISEIEPPSGKPDFYILYCHGNGVDIGDIQFKLKEISLYLNGYVISFDYPGYGRSTGSSTESNVYESAETVYKYIDKKVTDKNKIIIWGRSVGTGPAAYLAEKHKLHPIILESPFLSAFRVVTRYPVIPFDKFPNIVRIKNLRAPLLILHGKKDKVIPFYHGLTLFETANSPKNFICFEKAGHNNIEALYPEKYWDSIKQFLEKQKSSCSSTGAKIE